MAVGRCRKLFIHPPRFYALFFLLTVLFFLSSGGLTLYNKWIISIYDFHFPCWLVTITYSVAAVLSVSARLLVSLPCRCCNGQTGCCGRVLRRAGIYPFSEDEWSWKKVGAIVGVGSMAAVEVATSNVSLL